MGIIYANRQKGSIRPKRTFWKFTPLQPNERQWRLWTYLTKQSEDKQSEVKQSEVKQSEDNGA